MFLRAPVFKKSALVQVMTWHLIHVLETAKPSQCLSQRWPRMSLKSHTKQIEIFRALKFKSLLVFLKCPPGPWFNIKMLSYQYWKSHCGDKTILRPSYLHRLISYTGKMTSLYWIGAQVPMNRLSSVDCYETPEPLFYFMFHKDLIFCFNDLAV